MSQLGGPGADIPKMSLSKYSWPGLLVKSILMLVPIRRSLASGCGFKPMHGWPLHERDGLQLHGNCDDTVPKGGVMAHERTLWDQVDAGPSKATLRDTLAKADAQQQTIKRLRGSGHWLTLLRVARTIPQPFTLNDISVAVWKACPEFFGMKGYPYPDNHKVHFILYGQRGLVAKGLLRRVQEGLFRVPEDLDTNALV